MESVSFSYEPAKGWSIDSFPALDSERTWVLAFGAPEFLRDVGPIAELAGAYPKARVMGCSSAGEIHGGQIRDGSLSVVVMRFSEGHVRECAVEVADGRASREVGRSLARGLSAPDLRAVYVLADGLRINGSELLAGIHDVIPPDVVVSGGMAGDGSRFEKTWVIADGKPRPGWVTALGLYGESIRVSHGSRGGWDAFGPERVVTRSEGNVLYELDGEPALALYKKYLGERAEELPSSALLFPLAIRSADSNKTVVRTILSVDEARGSMTFAGDIPEGAIVQLMRANFERLIDGAAAASEAAEAPEGAVTLAVSCVGRRLVLGERAEEEVEAALDSAPKGASMVGFYSYGEFAPHGPLECGVLHNQTMTLTRFWEA
ncbi:MAG: FIST C-terminal domain-containing protein [Myxococcales bacterium]|nr:FIST C-terminal domain-containing protein [Myxococcales bacterium]